MISCRWIESPLHVAIPAGLDNEGARVGTSRLHRLVARLPQPLRAPATGRLLLVLLLGRAERRQRTPWRTALPAQPAGSRPVLRRSAPLPAPASAGGEPRGPRGARVRD